MPKRVLIFIVSYNAEDFIQGVLERIPAQVWNSPHYRAEVLIIDDQSSDQTFERARAYARAHNDLPITVLYNAKNQGYGGNQKIGYHYAVQQGFDAVVLLHGDGQYAPELLPQMIEPLIHGQADVVLGSRMLNKRAALRGRMPLYKWLGNQVLTALQNRILGSRLAEFHTGYRAYSVSALASVPFLYNANYFDFDTDILIQLLDTGKRFLELPIPTFYGQEISRVDGFRYAALILRSSLRARLMRLGLFYHPKFDYESASTHYQPKFGYMSSHQFALDRVSAGARVLDIGRGAAFVARALAARGAQTIELDHRLTRALPGTEALVASHGIHTAYGQSQHSATPIHADVDSFDFAQIEGQIDTVLLLDILEHLRSPEAVLRRLRERFSEDAPALIITTGNVAFVSLRLGLLLGQFNYGKRGILDLDHTRLFTFYSLRNMLRDNGYELLEQRGIPAPFPLALGNTRLARGLVRLNAALIRLAPSLFAYQIAVVARPQPTLRHLLKRAREVSEARKEGPREGDPPLKSLPSLPIMNIWLLTSQFPPAIVGGIARYVANAAEMFARAGHQVTVVAADSVDDEQTLPGGARLLRFAPRSALLAGAEGVGDAHPAFPYNLLSHWPALSYELAERVAGYVARDGVLPDVIECQEYAALPYYLLQRRLTERHALSNVPLLVHLHSPDFSIARANQEPRFRLPGYWVGQMEKFAILAADGLLAPSRFLRDEVLHELPQLDPASIAVLPLPYPPLPLVPGRPTPGDLLYFGRLELRKGVLPLVQACAALWAQGHTFTLTLLGGDTYVAPRAMGMAALLRERYARWVAAGRLVIQDTPLPPEQLWPRLAAAWAVLVPSTWENFPNACIEAMGLGKLVLASTAGGQAEMIGSDEQAGLLWDWETPGACAAVIERALALDEAQMRAMGAAARARIGALTDYATLLPQRIAHFERLIERGVPQRRAFPCVTPGIAGNAQPPRAGSVPGLLSVVVPFYNLGAYVEQTLESVLAADEQPLELLLIDDGSDDPASLEALERAQQRHGDMLRIIRTPNAGLAAARNQGAEQARGEYVAFVDSDDLVEPPFFTRAIEVLRRYDNVSFVYSWVRFFGAAEGCWPTWNAELPYLLGHNMLTAFVVARRSDFLTFGRNSPALSYAMEDYDAWIGMLEQGCIGVSLPDLLVRYRLRPGSMHQGMNDAQALHLLDLIAQRHPQLYQRYGPELFGLLNANGPSYNWNHPAAAVEQVDTRVLRRYAEDLRQQHSDLTDSWHAQRRYIEQLEQQLAARSPRRWWRRRT